MHRTEDEVVAAEAVDPATLMAENQSLRDRLLRALAEAENVRRRAGRAAEEASQYAIADFAREIVSVGDNLRRAIAAAARKPPVSGEEAALLEGIQATERTLTQTLERFGISRIEALDARFDPTRHEAVVDVDDPAREPGTVAQVIEDGYTIHDRLLRPARVAVVKRRTNPLPPDDELQRPRGHQS